jgi:predicted nucleic acid-binding protein
MFTSNYVSAETYTALLVRVGRAEAIEWGRQFRAGSAIELARIDESLEDNAWALLESHADKQWSYVDATSFALMEREGVEAAFAFDHHFAQRGLAVLP